MKFGFKVLMFNKGFAFHDDYLFLRVINVDETNTVKLVWWYEDEYRHCSSIGQWRIKKINKQLT
jgi:hypothetical protein